MCKTGLIAAVTLCRETHPGNRMPEWLTIILLFACYIALMRWVFPRLGVPT